VLCAVESLRETKNAAAAAMLLLLLNKKFPLLNEITVFRRRIQPEGIEGATPQRRSSV